jgi:hypothetical protein
MKRFVVGIAIVFAPVPVTANPLKSLYTTIDLKDCGKVKTHPDGKTWMCRGLDGFPVYYAEDNLHTFVSVGSKGESSRAAHQTLGARNSIFPDSKARRSIVEWRFVRVDGKVVPYATILRYFTSNGRIKGQVLVVSRVVSGEVCHVAHIDALANPDAIALARKVADETSRKFNCADEPMTVGKTGRSPL